MMHAACFVPVVLQAIAMLVDEGYFHRRRGLPRWERIGHPLDTLTIALCLGWLVAMPRTAPHALPVYVALAIASTLFVTKDEPIHARLCGAGEHWLHAVLFVLHPIVLAAFAWWWWTGAQTFLVVQLALTLAFVTYQLVYWNRRARSLERGGREPAERLAMGQLVPPDKRINNAWYADLGARWYQATDTPIALLRAEARHRNPWLADEITRVVGTRPSRVLDLGCGAGLLANYLAERGHHVIGLDTTLENLAVARDHDRTGRVIYECGDACAIPHPDASFDVVCAMDLLEHVEDPQRLVAEVGRVLAPSGVFFFHTFNRTWQARLVVIKGVEWFVKNTPRELHVHRLFLTPGEVTAMCTAAGMELAVLRGSRPRFRWPLWRMLVTGEVGDDFAFTFTPSTKLGYTGYARKPRDYRDSGSQPPPKP